ncbi:MAG: hypothetical protein ACK53K_09035 [Burkholderiales bacterium]
MNADQALVAVVGWSRGPWHLRSCPGLIRGQRSPPGGGTDLADGRPVADEAFGSADSGSGVGVKIGGG